MSANLQDTAITSINGQLIGESESQKNIENSLILSINIVCLEGGDCVHLR